MVKRREPRGSGIAIPEPAGELWALPERLPLPVGAHYREITKYTLRIEPYVDIAVAVLFIELTDCYERCRVALHEGQEEGDVVPVILSGSRSFAR